MIDLTTRDTRLTELMDDPACDPHRLRRTYARFALVNRLVAGWGRVYRTQLRPRLAARASGVAEAPQGAGAAPDACAAAGTQLRAPLRVLDLGCGGGDVMRRLVALAHADGYALDAVGVDPDPRAIAFARSRGAGPTDRAGASSLTFASASSADLVARGERFDCIISNHVLHHLDEVQRAAFLSDSVRLLERRGDAAVPAVAIHSDIARGRLAYLAYAAAAPFVSAGTFLYTDGLRSIRRSFTAAELRQELGSSAPAHGLRWQVQQPSRFRLLLIANAPGDSEAAGV